MNYGFLDFLGLLGALGIFIYGMKIMSEALQKSAGGSLRRILKGMTTNRFMAVFTGFFITALVQSSSATTVMVVSFVNAGLLTLLESIGVIMGANIGTTITAWLVSALGFKVKIIALALPIIGVAFPFLFSNNKKYRNLAEIIIGFGILFIGLDFLKQGVPDIKNNPGIMEFLEHYTHFGYGSILLFLVIGIILTILVQS
ncbi:MAG TPA: Na/Pi cotransporter family protein, partial [Bacteroidetes bacterium]|nr:Na/Pi cotransporter family protein [Bacteroidota bacterium]